MKKEIQITCDMCDDLLPLVFDHIASEDSCVAVQEHLKQCERCTHKYEGVVDTTERSGTEVPVNDKKVIAKIRKQFFTMGITILLAGLLMGILIVDSNWVFYNFLIMPLIGGLGYLLLRKYWYWSTIGVVIITYVVNWLKAYQSIGGNPQYGLLYSLKIPIFYTVMFGILSLVGVAIGALLVYGLKKEE